METTNLKAALSELERDLESARDARHQIECEEAGRPAKGGWEEPAAVLPSLLNNIKETLLVVFEAANLPDTRQRLIDQWAAFEKDGGIGKTHFDQQFDYLESKPFDYIDKLVNSVRILGSEGLAPKDAYDLAMLETVLRKTPVLMHKRKIQPKSEKEIRDVMHDYLEAYFSEYKRSVTITGILRDFKPDSGVRNLKTVHIRLLKHFFVRFDPTIGP
jgi:hypothetical protein